MDDYCWKTDEPHSNNTETLADYLNNHMDSLWDIMFVDGSYAEVITIDGTFAIHASGDGDFTHHRVRFEKINSGI